MVPSDELLEILYLHLQRQSNCIQVYNHISNNFQSSQSTIILMEIPNLELLNRILKPSCEISDLLFIILPVGPQLAVR